MTVSDADVQKAFNCSAG
ncbi:hypothetical protein QN277_011994 [Acacia crassicarpa]|uniref:Uncharacterized protein n=1 Tax=Acacia crassicarpa TaxID=499986 RepID=A0AAE1MZS3_9FABA|nr:hypothetical protein QN277_011994 [Acacia crassicarpa]